MSAALNNKADAAQALRSFMGAPQSVVYRRRPVKVQLSGADTQRAVPPMSREGRRWTDGEFAILEDMLTKHPPEAIAARLGRSRSSICHKAWERNMSCRFRRVLKTPHLDRQRAENAQRLYAGCTPKMREIITAVSAERSVPIELILSVSRMRKVVHARQHIIWRVVRDTSMSMSAVSLRLDLDHTTCRHAVIVEDRRQGTNVHATRAAVKKVQP